jgi:DNA-binding NtrC family response regulator
MEDGARTVAAGDAIDALVGRPLGEVTDELVRRTLQHCNGNRTRTAQLLGIGVRTLFDRLQRGPTNAPSAAGIESRQPQETR